MTAVASCQNGAEEQETKSTSFMQACCRRLDDGEEEELAEWFWGTLLSSQNELQLGRREAEFLVEEELSPWALLSAPLSILGTFAVLRKWPHRLLAAASPRPLRFKPTTTTTAMQRTPSRAVVIHPTSDILDAFILSCVAGTVVSSLTLMAGVHTISREHLVELPLQDAADASAGHHSSKLCETLCPQVMQLYDELLRDAYYIHPPGRGHQSSWWRPSSWWWFKKSSSTSQRRHQQQPLPLPAWSELEHQHPALESARQFAVNCKTRQQQQRMQQRQQKYVP